MSIIRQIVDRCHVGESNRAVIRYVASRTKNWKAIPRHTRRQIMTHAISIHRSNRKLYSQVQRGF